MKSLALATYCFLYEQVVCPFIFRSSAADAHERMLRLLAWLDSSPFLCGILPRVRRLLSGRGYVRVGGITLTSHFMVAAGLVKGIGFHSESDALAAVESGRNIIPGWRSVPATVGLVEFGSFTRHARIGNPGSVVWRDEQTRSTQNRIGLRNPGAQAAAAFLARHSRELPVQFGINVAVSPGVEDPQRETTDVLEAFGAFVDRGVQPSWFTLNLSCPNTEDDPSGHQTEDQTRHLCGAVMDFFRAKGVSAPLWVKISPELSPDQYRILMRVFHEIGVRAVIATNTLPRPAPDDPLLTAGIGGGRLHPHALDAVSYLVQERDRHGYAVDVIGCGGVMDGCTAQAFLQSGARALQYWSALVYRGPLAAALIEKEMVRGRTADTGRSRPAGN